MENNQRDLDRAFAALSDPTRRAVLARLGGGPATVSDLAAPFAMGLPAFLKHLRVLEDSGLIATDKRGRVRNCRIVPDRLAALETWLDAQRAAWSASADRLGALLENQGNKKERP